MIWPGSTNKEIWPYCNQRVGPICQLETRPRWKLKTPLCAQSDWVSHKAMRHGGGDTPVAVPYANGTTISGTYSRRMYLERINNDLLLRIQRGWPNLTHCSLIVIRQCHGIYICLPDGLANFSAGWREKWNSPKIPPFQDVLVHTGILPITISVQVWMRIPVIRGFH